MSGFGVRRPIGNRELCFSVSVNHDCSKEGGCKFCYFAFAALAVLAVAGHATAATVIIDDFNDTQFVTTGPPTAVLYSGLNGLPDVFGGSREMILNSNGTTQTGASRREHLVRQQLYLQHNHAAAAQSYCVYVDL